MTHEDWPAVVANIPVGGTWELEMLITSEDGSAPDPALWSGHAEFTTAGVTVVTFDTNAGTSPNGSITLTAVDDTWTRVKFLLPSSFTSGLTPSTDALTGASQQAGFGSFSIWLTATPAEVWRVCDFWTRIYSE